MTACPGKQLIALKSIETSMVAIQKLTIKYAHMVCILFKCVYVFMSYCCILKFLLFQKKDSHFTNTLYNFITDLSLTYTFKSLPFWHIHLSSKWSNFWKIDITSILFFGKLKIINNVFKTLILKNQYEITNAK